MKIPISEAKRVCEKYNARVVMIVGWEDTKGETCIATYGETKRECSWAGVLADKFAQFIGLQKKGRR